MKTDKLKENKVIQQLKEIFEIKKISSVFLVGGAVVDILEGRVPKDYDLIAPYSTIDAINSLTTNGFIFKFETATAKTFKKGDVKVQILTNLDTSRFDFTISSSKYSITKSTLDIDELSFNSKILTPNNFTDKKSVLNSLARIPHWMAKGYRIKNETFFSLLNCLNTKLVPYYNQKPSES